MTCQKKSIIHLQNLEAEYILQAQIVSRIKGFCLSNKFLVSNTGFVLTLI